MSRVTWSPIAQVELEDIIYYIRERDGRPDTARRIARQIYDAVEQLATRDQPTLTHPEAPAGWHYIRFKRWLIFYVVKDNNIEIMRIVDVNRDLPRQFQ